MNKFVKVLVVLSAFAVLPASALANNNPLLEAPTGTVMPPGTNIVATNEVPMVMTDTDGNPSVSCNRAIMTGTLVTNSHAGGIAGNITSASFAGSPSGGTTTGHCDGTTGPTTPTPMGLPWCLRSDSTMKTDEFTVRGGDCAKPATAIQYTVDITSAFGTIQCGYQRTAANPIRGTYTTHPAQATLTISKVEIARYHGSFLCPANGFLDMDFFLYGETSGGVEHAAFIKDAT